MGTKFMMSFLPISATTTQNRSRKAHCCLDGDRRKNRKIHSEKLRKTSDDEVKVETRDRVVMAALLRNSQKSSLSISSCCCCCCITVLSVIILFMLVNLEMRGLVEASSSSSVAITRKLQVLNNQHAPKNRTFNLVLGKPNYSHLSNITKPSSQMIKPTTATIQMPSPINGSTNQRSNIQVFKLNSTTFERRSGVYLAPEVVEEEEEERKQTTNNSKPQRGNDRRLLSNKLITSESQLIPTTLFDDDHLHDDDLYQFTGHSHRFKNSKTRSASNKDRGMKSADHQAVRVAVPSMNKEPQTILNSSANATSNDSPMSVSQSDNKSNLEATSGVRIRVKAATSRRSVGEDGPVQALTSGGYNSNARENPSNSNNSSSSLQHLTLANEYSLLPVQSSSGVANNDVTVINNNNSNNLPHQPPDQVIYDDATEDNDVGGDLSLYDRNTVMMRLPLVSTTTTTTTTNSGSSNNNTVDTKGNSSRNPPQTAVTMVTNLSSYGDEDENLNNKQTNKSDGLKNEVNVKKANKNPPRLSHDYQDQLSSLLLNSDVRVTSELLVLNKSSPIDGLVVRNLSGKAELRNPHSFFRLNSSSVDNNNNNNNGKPMVWPASLVYEEPPPAPMLSGDSDLETLLAPPTHLNILEEDSVLPEDTGLSNTNGDISDNDHVSSSLKLNWRGPIEEPIDGSIASQTSPSDTTRIPLEERTFYGPFSSGGQHRLNLGLLPTTKGNTLHHEHSGSYTTNTKKFGQQTNFGANNSIKSTHQHRHQHHHHPPEPTPTANVQSNLNSNSTIRLKAAASMTGIRVTTDPKLASELIINSRGLITAPKKRTNGSSNFNGNTTNTNYSNAASKKRPIVVSKGDTLIRGDSPPIRITISTKKHPSTGLLGKGSSSQALAKGQSNLVQDFPEDVSYDRPDWLKSKGYNHHHRQPIMMNKPIVTPGDKTIWPQKKNSTTGNSASKFNNQHQQSPTYDLLFEDDASTGGSSAAYDHDDDDGDKPPFLSLEKGPQATKLATNSGAFLHDRGSGHLSLPNRIVVHDISVLDDENNDQNTVYEIPDSAAHKASSASSFVNTLDHWLSPASGNSTPNTNNRTTYNNHNNMSSNSQYFYHNPPYKHHHLPPSAATLATLSPNLDGNHPMVSHQLDRNKQNLNRTDEHQYSQHGANNNNTIKQANFQRQSHTHTNGSILHDRKPPISLHAAGNSSSSSSPEINYLQTAMQQQLTHGNSVVNPTTTPPYESSAAMISINSTLSPQLNELNTVNRSPISGHHHQSSSQTTNHSSSSSSSSYNGNKPTSFKFKNKLQNIIIGKILKNTQSLSNYTSAGNTGSATSPQPSWSSLPLTLSSLAPSASSLSQASSATTTTTTSMMTPPPLLSTTVANNVASLLAQKLNFLVKPTSFSHSPFGTGSGVTPPAQGQVTHNPSNGGGGGGPSNGSPPANGLGLSSLFGIRVGSGNQAQGANVASRFKQRINPFVVTPVTHSSVNRRTTGVGSLLISGFIYGLSVLPALMALTGINPLNQVSDQTAALSSSTTTRNGNGSPNTNNNIRSANGNRKLKGPRLPVGATYATGPYAYLVPMISTIPDTSIEPAVATSVSPAVAVASNHHHHHHHDINQAQQTAIKSLYAPPPTIIEPHHLIPADSTHPILDEPYGGTSSYDTRANHHHHHHHRPYYQPTNLISGPPNSLQLASSMRLINEQLHPYATRYKQTEANHLRYSQPLVHSSNDWPAPTSERADEFSVDEMNLVDGDDNNYPTWHQSGQDEPPIHQHDHQRNSDRFNKDMDPIGAGGSQQHPIIDRIPIIRGRPAASRRNSLNTKMMLPVKNNKLTGYYYNNNKPTKVTKASAKHNLQDVSNYSNGNMDQWRAIPAPAIKYNANNGQNKRRAMETNQWTRKEFRGR